jgi:hypothetical protein
LICESPLQIEEGFFYGDPAYFNKGVVFELIPVFTGMTWASEKVSLINNLPVRIFSNSLMMMLASVWF